MPHERLSTPAILLGAALALLSPSPVSAQAPRPTAAQLSSWVSIRQERVNLLRDEIKQSDARIEARLDVIMQTLLTITDSKDSRTKVARMKEETGKRLGKTITYYDQKRAALKEELRRPQTHLTPEEKQKLIAIFDERIAKRTNQILSLQKSMPSHEDHERYRANGNGWYGTQYERNAEYDQNRRMTSHSNTQRTAIVKQLDASMQRLDRQARTLKTQIAGATDAAQKKALTDELTKTEALIAERRQQKLDTLQPSGYAAHTVALKEATDLDRAMQSEIVELRRDFDTLFQRYNTCLGELSLLHQTEKALAAAQPAR